MTENFVKSEIDKWKKWFFLKGLAFSLIIFFFLGKFVLKIIKTEAFLKLEFQKKLIFFLAIIYLIYSVLKIFGVLIPLPRKLQQIQKLSTSGLLGENLQKRINEVVRREFFLSLFLNLVMIFIIFLFARFVYLTFSMIHSMINSLR